MKLSDLTKELLKDEDFAEEYHQKDLFLDISEMFLEARAFKGLTQTKLAKLMGTKQPSIARVENGKSLPSLEFLEKAAKALGTYLIPPKFGFLEKSTTTTVTYTAFQKDVPIWKNAYSVRSGNNFIEQSPLLTITSQYPYPN